MSIHSALWTRVSRRLATMKTRTSVPIASKTVGVPAFAAWEDMQLEIWEQRTCKPAHEHGTGGAA